MPFHGVYRIRATHEFIWWWAAPALALALAAALSHGQEPERKTPAQGSQGQLARIKDVATIEGIRDNQLVGYGLVVGLHATGDSSQTVFPAQTLVSALEKMGITVPQTGSNSASNMQVKNMAAVFVVGTLPPFSRPGYKMDITVSSAGDARSLEGGILLMTPLYGPDGQIYAQAQGALVLGGYMAASGGNSKHTTARVPGGALVERPVPFDLKQMQTVNVILNDADFHTAEQMSSAINQSLGSERAHAVDSANNGTMNSNDLKTAAQQLSGVLDEITSLANSNYQGQYIFAGGQTSAIPFTTSTATSPAVTTYNGDEDVNYIDSPNGQKIQLNVPGDQIFLGSGANSVFGALNALIADYSSGTVNTEQAVSDTAALGTALNYVSQRRVTIDSSISQLTAASGAVTSEQTQLTAAQTDLMQADIPTVSTQLSLSETQQTALEDVIAQLESTSNNLFSKLPQ